MTSQITNYQYSQPRWFMRIIFMLVFVTCLRVWIGPVSILHEAKAQLPDSALQRKHILEETRKTNRLLTEIKQILRSETLHVRIQGADN